MTTEGLLKYLPGSYDVHTNDDTVYNTLGHDYDGDDYTIEINNEAGLYEVRHTGGTVILTNIRSVLDYIS